MASEYTDDRLMMLGNFHNYSWNKKLCFEARDSLYDCVDSQDNGNKYRCPDQLYAYEMWCPPDFRTIHSNQRRQQIRESEMYSKEWVDKVNKEHQTIDTRKYTRT